MKELNQVFTKRIIKEEVPFKLKDEHHNDYDHIAKTGKLAKIKSHRPIPANAQRVTRVPDADYYSEVPGVYYHFSKGEWRLVYRDPHCRQRRMQKTYSIKKYGFYEAREKAVEFKYLLDSQASIEVNGKSKRFESKKLIASSEEDHSVDAYSCMLKESTKEEELHTLHSTDAMKPLNGIDNISSLQSKKFKKFEIEDRRPLRLNGYRNIPHLMEAKSLTVHLPDIPLYSKLSSMHTHVRGQTPQCGTPNPSSLPFSCDTTSGDYNQSCTSPVDNPRLVFNGGDMSTVYVREGGESSEYQTYYRGLSTGMHREENIFKQTGEITSNLFDTTDTYIGGLPCISCGVQRLVGLENAGGGSYYSDNKLSDGRQAELSCNICCEYYKDEHGHSSYQEPEHYEVPFNECANQSTEASEAIALYASPEWAAAGRNECINRINGVTTNTCVLDDRRGAVVENVLMGALDTCCIDGYIRPLPLIKEEVLPTSRDCRNRLYSLPVSSNSSVLTKSVYAYDGEHASSLSSPLEEFESQEYPTETDNSIIEERVCTPGSHQIYGVQQPYKQWGCRASPVVKQKPPSDIVQTVFTHFNPNYLF